MDERELAEAVAGASEPLCILGGGTRQSLGHLVEGKVLDISGISGISLYEPGALTIVAGAGTPLKEIEHALAQEGQRLPFEPMDHRNLLGTTGAPTIGGIAACNISGPRRIQAGACRDYMLGVRYVNGLGEIVKNGGRVMKNVTGYDLVKLMAGSFGTLGVLSEVAFKVLPNPQSGAMLTLEGLSDEVAIKAMSTALTSPYEVTGAAHIPQKNATTGKTIFRLEGFEGSVKYRSAELREVLTGFGEVQLDTDQMRIQNCWAAIRDVDHLDGDGDIWRISVKPSQGPDLVRKIDPENALYDWGGGLIWIEVKRGSKIRGFLEGMHGHATLIRASENTKTELGVFHQQNRFLDMAGKQLRQKFDPRGILNPGRMGQ